MIAKFYSFIFIALLNQLDSYVIPIKRFQFVSSGCSELTLKRPNRYTCQEKANGEVAHADLVDMEMSKVTVDIFDAIMEGDAESVSRYITQGGDINVRDSIGDSPMMLAAENDMGHIIKVLVKEGGANVNDRSGEGMETPLILAAYYGYTGLCSFLVEHCEADLEVRSSMGDTALNIASHWGNVDTVKYLIEVGADPNCVNYEGKKAGDDFEMVFVDTEDGETIKEALHSARQNWTSANR